MQDVTLDEQLSTLFGDSRAEWLGKRIFDLFAKPAYFPELEQRRPCVLIGGRGTGKTMVLRGLSYEGRYALSKTTPPSDWPYYGLYYKVNTNRVTAFAGPEISEDRWTRLFAHYVNLLLCEKISNFMMWYEESVGISTALAPDQFRVVCESMHIEHVNSFPALSSQIRMSLVRFESLINNIGDSEEITLTTQGVPIDVLCDMVSGLPGFESKQFYFLIDEYESLSPLQQRVFNTLIKNCGERYSFKIGVRELGWRVHETLNSAEILESPADYARIDISERLDGERFSEFALEVCNNRLSQLPTSFAAPKSITGLFPGMSDEDEATHWDVESLVSESRNQLLESFPDDASLIEGMEPLKLYFLAFWARGAKLTLNAVFNDFREHQVPWQTRYGNYKHSLLYTLRAGRRGVRTRKLYAGWKTYEQLAGGNIRYLLALVYRGLVQHLRGDEERSLASGLSVETQTQAAKSVARERLEELEGLSADGTNLAQLVMGLGKIFGTMAVQADGHAPEVTQFRLASDTSGDEEARAKELLRDGVMLLALRRFPGTKPTGKDDIRQYDYMLYPLFSALFDFSFRKKRRTELSSADIVGLVEQQRQTVIRILVRSNRTPDDALLGDQLSLLEALRA
jgi:hypothetical protein